MNDKEFNKYLVYGENLSIGVGDIYNNIDKYKIQISNTYLYKFKKPYPYYLVYVYDKNNNCKKISKISAIDSKYIYVRSIFEKPKMIDFLDEKEKKLFIDLLSKDNNYKQSLENFNIEYSDENKYWKNIDINRDFPNYYNLENNKYQLYSIKFYLFLSYIKFKLFYRKEK